MRRAVAIDGPPSVRRTDPLAYTGATFHMAHCKRAQGTGRVTIAPRAATNRVPCPVCLPLGVVITT